MNKKLWTEEEVEFLKNNYLTKTYQEIANVLNRKHDSVRGKLDRMGLRKIHEYPKVGQKYDYLTVVEELGLDDLNYLIYLCKCECGNFIKRKGSRLSAKNQPFNSCGCYFYNKRRGSSQSAKKVVFNKSKKDAEKRGLVFTLTEDQFYFLIASNCNYCGEVAPLKNHLLKADGTRTPAAARACDDYIQKAWIKRNGIDRKDSNKGYTLDNSVSCCWQCNQSKLDWTLDEFLYHAKKIVEHQNKKVKQL